MRVGDLLKKHSLRDLIPFAFSELVEKIDRAYSSMVFRLKCRWHGVSLGMGCRIWGRVKLRRFPGSQIRIGKGFYLVNRAGRYAFNVFPQALIRTYASTSRIEIADGVGGNSISIFCRSQTIRIGARTMIGGNCQIMDSDGHPLWPLSARWHYTGTEHDAPVEIGEDVYIGLNVIVLKGTTIGNGAVIAAGSVVSGEIPPNCIAGGVPARVLRRLDEE